MVAGHHILPVGELGFFVARELVERSKLVERLWIDQLFDPLRFVSRYRGVVVGL